MGIGVAFICIFNFGKLFSSLENSKGQVSSFLSQRGTLSLGDKETLLTMMIIMTATTVRLLGITLPTVMVREVVIMMMMTMMTMTANLRKTVKTMTRVKRTMKKRTAKIKKRLVNKKTRMTSHSARKRLGSFQREHNNSKNNVCYCIAKIMLGK